MASGSKARSAAFYQKDLQMDFGSACILFGAIFAGVGAPLWSISSSIDALNKSYREANNLPVKKDD